MLKPATAPAIALAFGILAHPLIAQTELNLSGKITDPTGNGVPGVAVSLKKLGRSTVSAADGTYRLDSQSAALDPSWAHAPADLVLRQGRLEFRLPADGLEVRVTLHDLSGRLLASVAESRLDQGSHRLDLGPALEAAGFGRSRIGLLRILIGADAFAAKLLGSANGIGAGSLGSVQVMRVGPLAKSATFAALQDSILVSKAGYDSDYKRIDSYTGVHNFFMAKTTEFWGDPATQPAPPAGTVRYHFLNRTMGKYPDNQVFWKLTGLFLGTSNPIPVQTGNLATKPYLDLPLHHGGRVTFSLGTPDNRLTDFIEQTYDNLGWHGNTTRVDAYVLPMAMRLVCADRDERLGEKFEIFYLGREKFFELYKKTVPVEFHHTVDNGQGYRIIAPGKGDGGFGPGASEKYRTYFDAYLKQLNITGDGATTWQAFQCHGHHFGENAQLCGAVNRHVAHLPKSEWHNPEHFYKASPANFYAKFFHDYSFQEKAYGFAYDDAANMAAFSECPKPKTLAVAIGY